MADDPSQALDAVQTPDSTPPTQDALREQAIADAREEMPDMAKPEAAPQATIEGTDEEPAGEAPEGDEPREETTAEETPAEIDWGNPEQRDAELDRLKADTRERLDNQKRSLTGEFAKTQEGLEARVAGQEVATLLRELDRLREEDPEAYADRLNTDPRAATAIASRAVEPNQEVLARAAQRVVATQTVDLFATRPELEAMAQENGEAWQAAVSGEGRVFGYINRTAIAEGEKAGVEKFKQSSDYKTAIQEAEERGKNAALADLGMSGPPPSDSGTPSGAPASTFDNPRQAAAEEARRELAAAGTPVAFDASRVSKGRTAAMSR